MTVVPVGNGTSAREPTRSMRSPSTSTTPPGSGAPPRPSITVPPTSAVGTSSAPSVLARRRLSHQSVERGSEQSRALQHREVAGRQLDRFDAEDVARDPSGPLVVEDLVVTPVQEGRRHGGRLPEGVRRLPHA